jgi:hypothetical protein
LTAFDYAGSEVRQVVVASDEYAIPASQQAISTRCCDQWKDRQLSFRTEDGRAFSAVRLLCGSTRDRGPFQQRSCRALGLTIPPVLLTRADLTPTRHRSWRVENDRFQPVRPRNPGALLPARQPTPAPLR